MGTEGKSYKIAFVSTMGGVSWGGSEELWSQTALRLAKLGHKVQVSVFEWPQRHSRLGELDAAGAKVSFRPTNPTFAGRLKDKCIKRLFPGHLDPASMNWLRRQSPDLVIVSQGYIWDGLPWMLACSRLGISYCPIVHANSEIWWPEDNQLPSAREAYSGATKIFFVSRSNQELMEFQCGMRFDEGEVIVNPWKVDSSQPAPWPDPEEHYQLACVGRLDPRAKGQDLLMRVLSKPKWKARPLQLNIYGEGPCEGSLKAMADLLDLPNVIFKGQVSDVESIWAENHALVLPSRFEGLPLVIVEAMFCGRMVIATNVAGNAEYIVNDVNGFVASAPTVDLLDEAMERAWMKRSEWQRMGVLARSHAIAKIPKDPVDLFTKKLLGLSGEATSLRDLSGIAS